MSPPSNRTGFRRDTTTTAHRPGSRQSNGSRPDLDEAQHGTQGNRDRLWRRLRRGCGGFRCPGDLARDGEPVGATADRFDREGEVFGHLKERHVGVSLGQEWLDELHEPADEALAARLDPHVAEDEAAAGRIDDQVRLSLRVADLTKEKALGLRLRGRHGHVHREAVPAAGTEAVRLDDEVDLADPGRDVLAPLGPQDLEGGLLDGRPWHFELILPRDDAFVTAARVL